MEYFNFAKLARLSNAMLGLVISGWVAHVAALMEISKFRTVTETRIEQGAKTN